MSKSEKDAAGREDERPAAPAGAAAPNAPLHPGGDESAQRPQVEVRPRAAQQDRPFWIIRKRTGHDHSKAKGGEAQKAWSSQEDAVLAEAFQVRGRDGMGKGLSEAYWESIAARLPGRSMESARKRFRRLLKEKEHGKPATKTVEVDMTLEWPKMEPAWVDRRLWPGASAEGWIAHEGVIGIADLRKRYVWINTQTGDRFSQRRHVVAIHETEMRAAICSATAASEQAAEQIETASPGSPGGSPGGSELATAQDEQGSGSGSGDGSDGAVRGSEDPSHGTSTTCHGPVLTEWEGHTLVPSCLSTLSSTGYQGVGFWKTVQSLRRYTVHYYREPGHKRCLLGRYATALEGAVAYSKFIGEEAAVAEAARVRKERERRERVMTLEEAEAQAAAEGLSLVHDPRLPLGYPGVRRCPRCSHLPFTAYVHRNGKKVSLGAFSSRFEAALAYTRALGPSAAAPAQSRWTIARKRKREAAALDG